LNVVAPVIAKVEEPLIPPATASAPPMYVRFPGLASVVEPVVVRFLIMLVLAVRVPLSVMASPLEKTANPLSVELACEKYPPVNVESPVTERVEPS
jgi:hypothetical protein